ncbi:5-pentadecatrienyl resorcinol O-methyltransferase-like [Miscanthus floridulus]|uniref:5-pentadecatrienyl resorcinol O-methyltransferase-like n=1 Tax=Miscanthus floridulus TaxID=154761 RepID=UPI003459314B
MQANTCVLVSASLVINPQGHRPEHNTMALSSEYDSRELLQAQVELWNQTYSFMKSVALAVALDLRIADAIHRCGGTATLSQILGEIGVNPCKLAGLRRLMRVLTVSGTFAIQPSSAQTTSSESDGREPVYKLTIASRLLVSSNGSGESSATASLSPMLNHVLSTFHDSPLSMGLTAWFRNGEDEQEPIPCPFTQMHGVTLWELSGRDDAINASVNNALAADSHFLMQVVLKEFGDIFHGIDSLVDVGGGVGGAAMAIVTAFPCLKCTVLDLHHVVAKAPSISIGNVQFIAGDMFESIPPANAVFRKCIFHDWSDDECIKILKNCKQAIPSRDAGGKVIIIDIVIGSNSSDTKLLETQIICDLDIMKIGGVERDEQEWKKIFLEAGFNDYNIMSVLGLRSIIELYP